MEEINKKNNTNSYVNRLPNLDPDGDLPVDCYDLTICSTCLVPYGKLERSTGHNNQKVSQSLFQYCQCKDYENQKAGKIHQKETGHNAEPYVDFCHCCSKELIKTGSKYNPFYCADCLRLVLEYNSITDRISVPVGRHSFLNGLILIGTYSKKEEREFNIEIDAFIKKIGIIKEWHKYSLFENLHDLGFDLKSDIPVSEYDRMVVNLRKPKQTKFNEMVEYLKNQKSTN